ncbi:Chitin synthase, class 2 [Phlyctochytrium bullatum]|nr:Chitin synthase, class 2 [Phlyctochytrium bullatum]
MSRGYSNDAIMPSGGAPPPAAITAAQAPYGGGGGGGQGGPRGYAAGPPAPAPGPGPNDWYDGQRGPYGQQHYKPSGPPPSMGSPYAASPAPGSNPYGASVAPASQSYGQQSQQQAIQRKRTVRQVELTASGNLVVDVPVPAKVLQLSKIRDGDEFTKTRYTACTEDADNFVTAGYTLRQQEYGRKTEIFIVVTMYNEGDDLFCKTMLSLYKNISYLCQRSRSSTWGEQGWKSVVICIVSDGRTKINPRVLSVLGLMGVYQDGIMKNMVNGKEVKAHIFEFTSQIVVDSEMNVLGLDQGFVPVQILFCLKEKNAKKINSHRWFFNAFGPILRPNVCILIDVGTKPTSTSIYHLWKVFDRDPKVGGACGEIYAELGPGCSNLFNPLVAAQNFEYKMSNILDKPLESVFGFIAVLPGAFSAYRYAALQGMPLQQYFRGETMHGGSDIFAANMYLAEDRILCFELVTKIREAWLLRYVKAAKAETDVPAAVPEFISQRRRWLNGSFFAGIHALSHWYYIFRSGHSMLRKIALCVEFVYNFINVLFNWFGLANFYLAFFFLGKDTVQSTKNRVANRAVSTVNLTPDQIRELQLFDPLGPRPEIPFFLLSQLYIMFICLVFICSLGNRPQGSKVTYTMAMVLFALVMAVMLYLAGFTIYAIVIINKDKFRTQGIGSMFLEQAEFRDMVISVGSTYGLYFFASFLYFEPWHMFTSFIQYMFLLPSYVNILMVYAFCNLHDVSWGTKGDNQANKDLGEVKSTKGKDGKDTLEIDVPSDMNDINAGYDKFVQSLREPRPNEKAKRDAKTKQEDYFRNFRTKVILWWLFTNGVLIIALSSDLVRENVFKALSLNTSGSVNPYLKFIFYSVLGLSFFRFVGCIVYLMQTLICG